MFFNIFSSAFPPPCFLPTFFQLLCQPSGSEFLCNLSACCTSCLTMLHLWFYYIAAKDLWPSRLFASCDRNLQPAAAVCRLPLPLLLPPRQIYGRQRQTANCDLRQRCANKLLELISATEAQAAAAAPEEVEVDAKKQRSCNVSCSLRQEEKPTTHHTHKTNLGKVHKLYGPLAGQHKSFY